MEINPDGSKIDKTLGNKFDVNRGNHMTAVQGFMMSSVNGPHYELKASDHVKETQGTVEERKLNDHKVETAGNIFLGAGENIRVNGVNLYFDGATLHIVGEKLMIRAGEIDIKGADALRIESGKGISLKAAEAIKIESAADVNLKAGSDMKLQGGTYHNASGQSNFSTIAWGTAIGPPPAGSGPAPSAPASADAAKDADESNYKTNVTRAKTQTALFKPEAPLPSATDFELDSGTRGGYRDALNQGYTPSGSPVDSDFPMMVGSDDFHEPGCLFTATSMKQVFCNLVDERSLLNVQGVKNFLKYTRRDGIAIPDITVEQLEQIVKVAQKNRYPLDMMIGILSFKNWSGAESVAQNGRQAFQAILSATGGRHPLRGEMYMAYEHGIQAATRLIKKALDPSTMNKYVVQEPLKRKKDASPEDADAARKRELFMLPNAQSFQRWQTFREHYDRMHDRINHGFGRVIIPGLISKLPI